MLNMFELIRSVGLLVAELVSICWIGLPDHKSI